MHFQPVKTVRALCLTQHDGVELQRENSRTHRRAGFSSFPCCCLDAEYGHGQKSAI